MSNETLADIVREMRAVDRAMWSHEVRAFADRIEAARKRETAGNAAALRAALEDVVKYLGDIIPTRREIELIKSARAALSAPPRNCDRFDCAEEAWVHYCDDVGQASDRSWKALILFGKWLFATAEGGAE